MSIRSEGSFATAEGVNVLSRQWLSKWLSFDQFQLNTRSTWIVLTIGCVFLLAALEWFLIWPKSSEIDELQSHYERQTELRLQLEQQPKPTTVPSVTVLKVLEKTPIHENWESFIAEMQNIFKGTNVTVRKFDLQLDTQQAGMLLNGGNQQTFVNQPFTVSVSGKYSQLTAFLDQMNRINRVVRIKNWEMSAISAADIRTNPNESPQQPAQTTNVEDTNAQEMLLNVSAEIFQVPGYAKSFEAVLPQPTISAQKRVDPTLTDQQFYSELQVETQNQYLEP